MSRMDDYLERSARHTMPFVEEFVPKGFLAVPFMFLALIGMIITEAYPQYETYGGIATAVGFVASALIWGRILCRTCKRIYEDQKKR